jgi:multidrug efflux pump subunit AcrA (membrane-fusion protein)
MLRSPRSGPYSLSLSLIACLCIGSTLVACKKPETDAGKSTESVALILGNEDIVQLGSSEYGTGPVISGSLQPEIRADLRAEISATVVKVHKENGEPVRKGDLLVSLDSSVLRDNLNSAEESMRAAAQSLDGAERQFQRMKSLQAQGMVSMQGLEEAEVKRSAKRACGQQGTCGCCQTTTRAFGSPCAIQWHSECTQSFCGRHGTNWQRVDSSH